MALWWLRYWTAGRESRATRARVAWCAESSGRGGTIQTCAIFDIRVRDARERRDGRQIGREPLRDGHRAPLRGDRSRSCASSGAPNARESAGTGSGSRGGPVSATGGRARRPARRSAKRCFWRPASSRSGCSTPQRAQARSRRTCDRPGTPGELCAAPAVPPALARRRSGDRGRRHRGPWLVGRQRECGSRRRVPAHSSPLRSPCARATGSRSLAGVGSVRTPRMSSSARSPRWWRRAGGCATRSPGAVGETLTRWRSPQPELPSLVETKTRSYDQRHLARVREQVAWLSRRRRRWARNGPLASCASSVRGASSASSTTFWWCRSTA